MDPRARAVQQFIVDPREVISLYHRCVRCLFVRVRENDERRMASPAVEAADKFYGLAAKWMQNYQATRPWQKLSGKEFRVISQGRRVLSSPICFPDVNVELSFSAKSDALVELKDGSSVLVAYHVAVPVERRQKQRDLEIEAEAYALENPADSAEIHAVEHLGGIEFLVTGSFETNSGVVLGSSRITLLERRTKRMKDFMRVVAGVVGARIAPPANQYCEFCRRSAIHR